MTPPPQPPPARGNFTGELLGRILSYADTPIRAALLICFLVVGGLGWIIYENRSELIEAWLTPDHAELRTADIPDALEKLVAGSDADLVQIWAVDLAINSQKFIGARRRDGERPWIPQPRRLPIIIATSDIAPLLGVIEGRPVCLDLDPSGSPIARRLSERGLKRGCAIPIPPSPEAFVGVIYLAWNTAPDASAENIAITAAREISATLVTR